MGTLGIGYSSNLFLAKLCCEGLSPPKPQLCLPSELKSHFRISTPSRAPLCAGNGHQHLLVFVLRQGAAQGGLKL